MAEDGKKYLQQCLQKNICPPCRKTLSDKVGSGKFDK
jgi:hypothetical protein